MKRKIGDIVQQSNGTYKVIGVDGAGRYVLTKTTDAPVEVKEETKPRRTRTKGV